MPGPKIAHIGNRPSVFAQRDALSRKLLRHESNGFGFLFSFRQLILLGKTIIIVTHWIDELISFKPNILHIHNNKINYKGSFDNFILLGEDELKKKNIVFSEKLRLYYCSLKNNIKLEKLFHY